MNLPSADAIRTPLHGSLLGGPLDDLDSVHLIGTRCTDCGECSLGQNDLCPNCGGESVGEVPLSPQGTLWSFTVIRHRPPGGYLGTEPFEPFGLGLVELPEGLRVFSPIKCDVALLEIGMHLRFQAYVREHGAAEKILFAFAPC